MPRYNPATIEPKWQKYWEENRTFATPRLPKGPKIYVLDMFPYPSGDGLHVGHPEGYTATDIVCRYRRMRGYSVMHPMGWDAFGLPAEQHAKRTGAHPRSTTEKNIANFRRQLKMLGFSYDWQREVATTDADYFRWTQFIFLVLFDTWFDAAAQRGRPIAELPDSRGRGRARGRRGGRLSRPAPPGLSTGSGGQLVSRLGHRAGQRGGPGGPERARRASGGPHAAAAMDAADHRLRRPPGARPGRPGLAGGHQAPAAQLDRPQHRGGGGFLHRHVRGAEGGQSHFRRDHDRRGARIGTVPGVGKTVAARVSGLAGGSPGGRLPPTARRERAADLHHPGRHALRGDLHGDCPGASAFRAADGAGAGGGGGRILPAGGPQERPRPHRPGQGEDRRLHRLLCDQTRSTAKRFPSGWPTTC